MADKMHLLEEVPKKFMSYIRAQPLKVALAVVGVGLVIAVAVLCSVLIVPNSRTKVELVTQSPIELLEPIYEDSTSRIKNNVRVNNKL